MGALLYLEPGGGLMSAPIGSGTGSRPGTPVRLAAAPAAEFWRGFDVSPDGLQALIVSANRNVARIPLDVIVHWPEAVRR
jgi:hypothetical protein